MSHVISRAALVVLTVSGISFAQQKTDSPPGPKLVVKYGDGKPDGKKSIAGTGEMIRFVLPNEHQELKGLRIHCARYGYPKAPDEEVEIFVVTDDESDVVHTELVPYAKFKRGQSRWTTIRFKEPAKVPRQFWVILDFNAERMKGVYVSCDTSTSGEFSKTGVPRGKSKTAGFGGDLMVQCLLTRPD